MKKYLFAIILVMMFAMISGKAYAEETDPWVNVWATWTDLGGSTYTATGNELRDFLFSGPTVANINIWTVGDGFMPPFWATTDPAGFVTFNTSGNTNYISGNVTIFQDTQIYPSLIEGQIGGPIYLPLLEGQIGDPINGSVAPEPVSSVLFLIGGAVLAARRRIGRKA